MLGFNKKERSTFEYWFAHWCAFQMTALNLHIWKPKYLLHDIEKPWLMMLWKDYKRVQQWHRKHNNHHVEYGRIHGFDKMDVDAMIIDNECSRFTKNEAQLTAIEFIEESIREIPVRADFVYKKSEDMEKQKEHDIINEEWRFLNKCLICAHELGLEK